MRKSSRYTRRGRPAGKPIAGASLPGKSARLWTCSQNRQPLIEGETQPVETMAALVRADERLKKQFSQLTLPVLIVHGTKDGNTRPRGSEHFFQMAGSADKTLKLYNDGFHDLLNDLDRVSVLRTCGHGSMAVCSPAS